MKKTKKKTVEWIVFYDENADEIRRERADVFFTEIAKQCTGIASWPNFRDGVPKLDDKGGEQ